ncbi:MAG: metal-dependent hydrolase [Gammaproteobacteria bacterium]|nr:metal-dependent hydrolase [Gammaproteobacteria bacterium]
MDVLSQAVLGASLSQSFAKDKSKQLSALLIGVLAGMAPDLDVLIYSSDDPILFLEFHRQFTHSLFFIPFGALLCTLVLYPFIKNKLTFSQIYLFSFLGFATHGLLDACTSYGTQLFWPFSDQRISWGIVSIVDPFFTIPIVIGIVFAVYRSNRLFARIAFIYAVIFLSLGLIQKQRAENALYTLAQQRGHQIERVLVKPSFGNRHVWKLIYEYNGRYYVDAVKLLWRTQIVSGTSIQKLNIKRDFPWLAENSQQAKDIERFRWFSDDFLAVNSQEPNVIVDMRYSFLPNQIKLMWGIELSQKKIESAHANFITNTKLSTRTRKQFIKLLF